VLVPARVILDRRNPTEPVLRVEFGRLEAVGAEDDLLTVTAASFLLCRLEELRSQTLAPLRFLHPELTDLTATAPGVPANPGDDSPLSIPHEDGKPQAIRDTRSLRVELIEPVFQVLDLLGRRFGFNSEFRCGQLSLPLEILRDPWWYGFHSTEKRRLEGERANGR